MSRMSRRPAPPQVVKPVYDFADSPLVQLLKKENEKLGKLKEKSVGGTMLKMPELGEETMMSICEMMMRDIQNEAKAYARAPENAGKYFNELYAEKVIELANKELETVDNPKCKDALNALIANANNMLGLTP